MEFYDGNYIKKICIDTGLKGEMFEKYNQYYFVLQNDDTFKPDFSRDDTLIIEYSDFKWSIQRNKTIDRSIRKSSQIHNGIIGNINNYVLKFTYEGKEIYPESDVI